jgi:hypothetical protein
MQARPFSQVLGTGCDRVSLSVKFSVAGVVAVTCRLRSLTSTGQFSVSEIAVFVRYHPNRALPDARVITDAGSAKSMLEETAT